MTQNNENTDGVKAVFLQKIEEEPESSDVRKRKNSEHDDKDKANGYNNIMGAFGLSKAEAEPAVVERNDPENVITTQRNEGNVPQEYDAIERNVVRTFFAGRKQN